MPAPIRNTADPIQPATGLQFACHSDPTNLEGYVEIKVDLPNPHTGAPTRFCAKATATYGNSNTHEFRKSCCQCLSADRTDCDPSNWELVPRACSPASTAKASQL